MRQNAKLHILYNMYIIYNLSSLSTAGKAFLNIHSCMYPCCVFPAYNTSRFSRRMKSTNPHILYDILVGSTVMPFSDDQIKKFGTNKRRLVWLTSDSWSWRQVLKLVLFFFFFWEKNFSIRFQTGHFCLPTLPKEAQQLPICTPVAQRDGAVTLVDTLKKKKAYSYRIFLDQTTEN